MKLIRLCCSLLLQLLIVVTFTSPVLAEEVNINLLQMNDVYEITPIGGGTRGGLARVATLRKELYKLNPRTYTVLAGDAFSPSALGTAKINDRRLDGQQMVAVLNVVGLNYATFGNHEFDLQKAPFYERLAESKFDWISSNASDSNGNPFNNVPRSKVLFVKGDDDAVVKVGFIGVTLDSNKPDYVQFIDPIQAAKEQVDHLKNDENVDIVVAITHLAIEDDRKLAESVPAIDIILGGHEHENIQQWHGSDLTPIFKADANASTVYLHKLSYDTSKKNLKINSKLIPITNKIADDKETIEVVQKLVDIGKQAFRAQGFEIDKKIGKLNYALDGLEASVRNRPTAMGNLIARAMLDEVNGAKLAIFNSGAIRIDDVIPARQPITQYDVLRMLPFGGKIMETEIKGKLLQQVLEQGQKNKGAGGYLQTANVSWQANSANWLIDGEVLNPDSIYKLAINDFLLTGKEKGLGFLKVEQNPVQSYEPQIKIIAEKEDIRYATIKRLKKESISVVNS